MLISKNPDYATAIAWCKANNIAHEAAGTDFFHDLNTQVQQPLWLPEIAQARNPRLLQALKQDLLNKGVCLREQSELQSVTVDNNRITGIDTTTGRLAVEQLIITTGAWTGQLFQRLFNTTRHAPNIAPVKGQMLLFEAKPDTLRHIVLDEDQYLIPRRDGKILMGSTVEHDDFNKTTTDAAKDKLAAFAYNLLPALENYPLIKHWAGLRPGKADGVPVIAQHPEITNLSINAGHFRNGLAMGPASAQLLVDIILKRPTAVDATLFTLGK